jgi:hypothetical protein
MATPLHPREKMRDRGPPKVKKNFAFHSHWRGKFYAVKQVAPLVAEEADRIIIVTVFVYYF